MSDKKPKTKKTKETTELAEQKVSPKSALQQVSDNLHLLEGQKEIAEITKNTLSLFQLQYARIMRAAQNENDNGGMVDPLVTNELTTYFTMLKAIKLDPKPTDKFVIEATGEAAKQLTAKKGVFANLLGKNETPNESDENE